MYEAQISQDEKRVERFHRYLQQAFILERFSFDIQYAKLPGRFFKFEHKEALNWQRATEGEVWGEAWDSALFNLSISLSQRWQNQSLALYIDIGAEALLLDDAGRPVYAFAHGSAWDSNYKKNFFPLDDNSTGFRSFWLEGAANGLFGIDRDEDPALDDMARHGHYAPKINHAELIVVCDETLDLYYDFDVLYHLMQALESDSVRRARLRYALNRAIDVFAEETKNAQSARAILAVELEKKANASALTAYSIGHAHIDTAWLWPVAESIRKTARTFASQMHLIDHYPGYKFGASQAQHYDFIRHYYPDLFARLPAYIQSDNWEIQGGMWVEADCNLIGGESMIRQFLYGKYFFKNYFNQDIDNLWLPDVFGYSAAMPQIMRKCGVNYFLTQKISWNQYNRFPYHSFIWRGIDGSEVLVHFNPTDTYNGSMEAKELVDGEKRYSEKGQLDAFLAVYGIGDGGGGPQFIHIERAKRQQDLEGSPRVQFAFARDFFKELESKKTLLPMWQGELYLELHRGTLTTQAKVKRANRKLEYLLKQTEMLYSTVPFNHYPQSLLESIWKKVLINQFHDILPGSSIHEVYVDTHKEYDWCFKMLASLHVDYQSCYLATDDVITIFNSATYRYTRPLRLDLSFRHYRFYDQFGIEFSTIVLDDGILLFTPLEPLSMTTVYYHVDAKSAHQNEIEIDGNFYLENEAIRYEFNRCGEITAVIDRLNGRSFLQQGNQFSLYIDRPNDWDAWDIDISYEQQRCQSVRNKGKIRLIRDSSAQIAIVELEIGASIIRQQIMLSRDSQVLDFVTEVDWKECHKMLRVSFDTDIHADRASFDIQFGFIKRNTHRNTSWDRAKFEAVAHRYVDLSNHQFGVALLNDCKYGHKVQDSCIDLNLLRASTYPDADADKAETHGFTYSLYPHEGNLISSDVIAKAEELNHTPLILKGRFEDQKRLPCRLLLTNSVVIETIKKSEAGEAWIVRVIETKGLYAENVLKFSRPMNIYSVNAIEWGEKWLVGDAEELTIRLTPFAIETFKFELSADPVINNLALFP
ncbi:MAG: alpha-mannosidase [Francisellaceae bacterium]